MAERYFTPAEVEALIPALTGIMERVMAAHAEATKLRDGQRAEQERVAMVGGAQIDVDAWRARRARVEALGATVQGGLAEIAALGGVPKDVALGLVDFPHLREGLEVQLCWKLGEREVRWWHGVDEGYAARKPL